jgi:hypothetical protein
MGTCSRSVLFDSDMTEPFNTVLIKTGGNDCPIVNLTSDEASHTPCMLTYITATTYANEVKHLEAAHGSTSLNNTCFVVEFDFGTPAIAYDGTQVDNAYADLDSLKAYEVKKNMEFWGKGSSLTSLLGEILISADNGLLTNVGDPDGATIAVTAFGFMAIAAMSSGTYQPVRAVDKVAYDATP